MDARYYRPARIYSLPDVASLDACSELGFSPAAIRELETSGALVGNFAARRIDSVRESVAVEEASRRS